ncbi:MAG: glycosyltransferase family 2 protein, partial [Erythrobacter sp.]|nr:glycosyltransferase family 2 protein [Erythrobacter sp.]
MSISVIIPFYNETIFLDEAVRSVLGLGDRLHQLLIIDDSPGLFPQILGRVRALDSRIEVVTNARNMGASAARNEGLKRVTGKQVLFLDSDDAISSLALLQASERMEREAADLVHIPTMVMNHRTSTMFRFPRDDRLFGKAAKDLSSGTFPDIRYALANWSFLFDADYLARNAIAFDPEQRMFEDHLFILNAVEKADNIALLGTWGHVWRKRGGSLTTTNYNATDMASQLASIRKCLGFLTETHGSDSFVVQRDVAFCLSRYVMTWPTLTWALAHTGDTEAADLLEDIAAAFRPYTLTKEVCANSAMERLFGSHLRLFSGPALATSRMHEVFETLVAGDWAGLASQLAIPVAASTMDSKAQSDPRLDDQGVLSALGRFHGSVSDS